MSVCRASGFDFASLGLLGQRRSALARAPLVLAAGLAQGPAGLWEHIKDQIGDLKTMIVDSLPNPASAFIKACKLIYDAVMLFVQRASQNLAFVNAVLDSVSAIAAGTERQRQALDDAHDAFRAKVIASRS